MTQHRRTTIALVLGAVATIATGCQPDNRRDTDLISEPQLSTAAAGDSIAPLYEMSNPHRLKGRYIVRFKPSVIDARGLTESLISGHGGRVYEVLPGLGAFWGELPDAAIDPLRRNPNVAYIEADVAVPVSGLRDSVQTGSRWPLDRVDQRTLPLNGRYEYSVVGSGVHIWIIDTGIDRNAPDLTGRIDESWYVTNNGKDPYAPCNSHGTNVATTAAGRTNGVAKGAIIHSARVDDNCTGGLSTGAASFAFEFIGNYSPRPAVINYSAGSQCHWYGCGQTVDDAAKYARQKGVTVIVAAGNDGNNACDYTPAHVPELLTVAASNASDQRIAIPGWWSSNWGSCVDIFAPVEDAGGTSNAAPMVTGAAALHLQLYPSATPAAAILAKSTKGVLTTIGSGSPNRLLYSIVLPPIQGTISGPTTIGHYDTCSWTVNASGGVPPFSYNWYADFSGSSTGFSFTGGTTSATATGWGYYYETYPEYTTVTLTATISDSDGQVVNVQKPVSLYGYSVGCY